MLSLLWLFLCALKLLRQDSFLNFEESFDPWDTIGLFRLLQGYFNIYFQSCKALFKKITIMILNQF